MHTRIVERGEPGVAGIPEVARLPDGPDAEARHPLELVWSRSAAVLDPVSMVVARMGLQRRLVRVEDAVDGAVALGVDADLPPSGMHARDRRAEVGLGRPVQRPREFVV